MKQLAACRCPACGGVHHLDLYAERTGGIDVDQQARLMIVCKWCLRHDTASTIHLFDRERACGVDHN